MKERSRSLIIDNVGNYSGNQFHNYTALSKQEGSQFSRFGFEDLIKLDNRAASVGVYTSIASNTTKEKAGVISKNSDYIVCRHKKQVTERRKVFISVEDIAFGATTRDLFFSKKCRDDIIACVSECQKDENITSKEMADRVYQLLSGKYPEEYSNYLRIIGKG